MNLLFLKDSNNPATLNILKEIVIYNLLGEVVDALTVKTNQPDITLFNECR
jgi:hypothetical protein